MARGDEFPLGRREPTDWTHVEKYPYAVRAAVGPTEKTLTLPRYRARYDQGREGACFPMGVLVRMADGQHCAIEDVRPLDWVQTAE